MNVVQSKTHGKKAGNIQTRYIRTCKENF